MVIEQRARPPSKRRRPFKAGGAGADDGRMRGLMRVSVGLETTDEEVAALERIFRLAEIPALVEEEIARFSVESPWVMYVSAPLAWFSSRFVRLPPQAPAQELGPGLASFIDQVSGAFRASEGSVVFTDEETEVAVALTPELPHAAYEALLDVDLGRVEGERLSWEQDQRAWYTLRGEPCTER
jgi:hypothetical protein